MFHNPLDYFLSVRLKIFIFQILQLGRTPNEFRHKPIYPLQKSFGRFYCTEFFQMEKRGTKNRHCQLSIFEENTEAHNLQYFYLFFSLRFVGFFGAFYPSFFSMFFWTSLVYFFHRTSLVYFLHNRVSYTYFIFYLPWFWYFLFNRKTTMAMTTTKTTTAMQSPIIMIKVSLLVEVFVAGK